MAQNQSSRHLRNLRGRSFKSQDLTGADFSYSDIRGADFTNATLVGANFSHALAGLPPNRVVLLIAVSFLCLALSGLLLSLLFSLLSLVSFPINDLGSSESLKHYIAAASVFIFFVVLGIFFAINRQERLTAALMTGAVSVVGAAVVVSTAVLAPGIAVAVTVSVIWVLVGAIGVLAWVLAGSRFRIPSSQVWFGWSFLLSFSIIFGLFTDYAFVFICLLSGATASFIASYGAWALMRAVDEALPFGLAWSLAGTFAFGLAVASSGLSLSTKGALYWAMQVAVTFAGVVTIVLLGAYLARLDWASTPRAASWRTTFTTFALQGSTSFRGANLTNATFTQATLKNTNFRQAILTGIDFANCRQLNYALLDENPDRLATSHNQRDTRIFLFLSLMGILVAIGVPLVGIQNFAYYFQKTSHPTEKINSLYSSTFLQKVLYGGSDLNKRSKTLNTGTIAISSDGQFLAGGLYPLPFRSEKQVVKLWNMRTGRLLRTFSGYNPVFSTVTSNDSQTLVLSKDNTIQLWNLKTGQLNHTFSASDEVSSLALSGDGQILASAEGNKIQLWNLQSREQIQTLSSSKSEVYFITMSADGQTLASWSSGIIKLWNLRLKQLSPTLQVKASLNGIALSPDGQTLAVGDSWQESRFIKLWDVKTGQLLRSLSSSYRNRAISLAFSPDGQTLASGTRGTFDKVEFWNWQTGELQTSFSTGGLRSIDDAESVAFSPNGQLLASSGRKGIVKIWRVPKL